MEKNRYRQWAEKAGSQKGDYYLALCPALRDAVREGHLDYLSSLGNDTNSTPSGYWLSSQKDLSPLLHFKGLRDRYNEQSLMSGSVSGVIGALKAAVSATGYKSTTISVLETLNQAFYDRDIDTARNIIRTLSFPAAEVEFVVKSVEEAIRLAEKNVEAEESTPPRPPLG